MKYNQYFLFNYGAEMSLAKNYTNSINLLKEAEPVLNDADLYIYMGMSYQGIGDYVNAEKCYVKASEIMPAKFYPVYRLVKLYQKQNRINESVQLAKNLLNMPVKIPSEIITNILAEMENYVNSQLN